MNIFGTVLTYAAPSSNYRGESAENRSVIQKISIGRFEYAIISPESMRNAVRETLRAFGLPCNRERLHDEEQLAVKFEDYPDKDRYVDDFFLGWLIAAGKNDRKAIRTALSEAGRDPDKFTFKRDSILRMNMAVALEPYRHDSVFTQSPMVVKSREKQNTASSQLLHRDTAHTAFQYPFALNLKDCTMREDWTKALLKSIGQLNGVAGNHARSYFEMAPASIVIRLTPQLVAGYETYGFKTKGTACTFPEVIDGILHGDYPGGEFYVGGKLVKDSEESILKGLEQKGVTLDRNPQRLLEKVGDLAFR
ncbi:MAG: type I-B CRISPR-associated protein Cas7/Cst2/DevR [Syntrophobacteraceae bacterium]